MRAILVEGWESGYVPMSTLVGVGIASRRDLSIMMLLHFSDTGKRLAVVIVVVVIVAWRLC